MPGTKTITLSVDAMGGDFAPKAVVEGLEIARVRRPGVKYLLHGDETRLNELVSGKAGLASSVSIRHASNVVAMDDKPSQALRRGRETSMWRAIDSVRQGEAQAAVSAGNTGALMAMAKFQLRPLDGIARPAIAAQWPTVRGQTVVLDVGANVGSEARHLVDFAVMGAAFARAIYGLPKPTLGLLNIGVEELKGNEHVKAAAQLLRDSGLPIQFQGFVEGDDISLGAVDVVVTDGFTGNVALKAAEGTAKLIGQYLKDALNRSWMSKLGAALASGAFRVLKTKMDPRSVNGGVFLGLNGLVVKSHGGTDGLGFASAVDLAVDMAQADLSNRIAADMASIQSALGRLAPPDAALADAAGPEAI